jgi:hypothetical protein
MGGNRRDCYWRTCCSHLRWDGGSKGKFFSTANCSREEHQTRLIQEAVSTVRSIE